jgi:hypothetical protein
VQAVKFLDDDGQFLMSVDILTSSTFSELVGLEKTCSPPSGGYVGCYEDQIWGRDDFLLSDALEWAGDDWRQDFDKRWGLGGNKAPEGVDQSDWIEFRKWADLAQKVASIGERLVRAKGIGPDRIAAATQLANDAATFSDQLAETVGTLRRTNPEAADMIERFFSEGGIDLPTTKLSLYRAGLQEAAWRLIPSISAAGDRLHTLASHAQRAPGARVASYLAKVARCYVFDLTPELTVMARAAMEAALIDAGAGDDEVLQLVGSGKANRIGLEKLIDYWNARGVLVGDRHAAAKWIKERGDEAVHMAPDLAPSPDETILKLMLVVAAVLSSRTAS